MTDPMRPPLDALRREVQEEIGGAREVERFVGARHTPDRDSIVFTFRCRVVGGGPVPDGRETAEVRRLPPDSLPRLYRVPSPGSRAPGSLGAT